MAVKKQCPVPLCRNFNQISCAVSKCSGFRGNASLRMCGTGNSQKKDRCHRQKKECSLSHSPHFHEPPISKPKLPGVDVTRDSEFVVAAFVKLTARTYHCPAQESFQSSAARAHCS